MDKRTKLIHFMLCLSALTGMSTASAQTLVLHHANGTTTDVELNTRPIINFQNDKVYIQSYVLQMEYAKDNILSFTYKGGATDISNPKADSQISRKNDRLIFHNIKPTDKIAIYNLKGILIPAHIERNGSSAILPLNAIPSGVYVLSVNGRTSKFTKK